MTLVTGDACLNASAKHQLQPEVLPQPSHT